MSLSKQAIEEFRQAFRQDFGEALSFDEAEEMFLGLLDFALFLLEKDGDLTKTDKNGLMVTREPNS